MTSNPLRRRVLQGTAAAIGTIFLPLHAATPRFTIGTDDFLLDGKPLQIRCGEMHFARVPRNPLLY